MSQIQHVFPEDKQWCQKRVVMRCETGVFKTWPFIGIVPMGVNQVYPEVGLGIILIDSNNNHHEDPLLFSADPASPPISIMHLLRALHVLQQVELVDLLHRQPNTLGNCWGMACLNIPPDRRNILKNRFGEETFDCLSQSVRQYLPKDHEEERNVLRQGLQRYKVPFVEGL